MNASLTNRRLETATQWRRIVGILASSLLCATSSEPAVVKEQKCAGSVSPAKLIANPAAFQGKALWVTAHITIEFENMTACPSGNETRIENCLWLTIDDGPHKTDQDYARYDSKLRIWKQFNRQTVDVRAKFDSASNGHFGMWPGGLGHVTEVLGKKGGWSFVSNVALARTACK